MSTASSFVGAACVGCRYGIGGVYPGDGGPPVDDNGHALVFFKGNWRCRLCMDDQRAWRRAECEAATVRGYALMRTRGRVTSPVSSLEHCPATQPREER
jgi:hypothetical protein